jgi:hypothetical protein
VRAGLVAGGFRLESADGAVVLSRGQAKQVIVAT